MIFDDGRRHLRRDAAVRVRASTVVVDVVATAASRESSPTVRWAIGANAAASWVSTMRRVTSSASYGTIGVLQELPERHVGQRHLRGGALLGGRGGDAGQPIARARRRGARQQRPQVVEHVARAVDHMRVASPWRGGPQWRVRSRRRPVPARRAARARVRRPS